MARKIGEIDLDLKEDKLEVWEPYCSSLNVSVLEEATNLGHILPRVDVVFEEGVYRLLFGSSEDDSAFNYGGNYGGHSRSVLALKKGIPLRCSLYNKHRVDPKSSLPPVNYFSIDRIIEYLDVGWLELDRVNDSLRFLPREVADRFIEEKGLVLVGGRLRVKKD